MSHSSNSLRTRLFLWYLVSLVILAIFFYAAVHIFMVPYSTEIFMLLFIVLAVLGFFAVKKVTSSLTSLSEQIRLISSHNLDRHIHGIESKDEIGEVAKAFNDLLVRLNEAFKREQQFIADVAHELKTPLATQRTSLEITLSKDRNKDEYKKALEDALIENNHISSTLKNVLDLAWSETPHEQKNTHKFNLSELLDEICEIGTKLGQSKNISVEKDIIKNVFIIGFREKLARALLNIIDNAIKYTLKNGVLSLTLEKKLNEAVITVRDTGQGIASKDLPHIFDRFYRGSVSDKVLGSGLGLAITKSIITLHNGSIKVNSIVGEGTTFKIHLPLKH